MFRQAKFDPIQYVISLETEGRLNKDGAALVRRGFDKGIELIQENFNQDLEPMQFAHGLYDAMLERVRKDMDIAMVMGDKGMLSAECILNLKGMRGALRFDEKHDPLIFYMRLLQVISPPEVAFVEPVPTKGRSPHPLDPEMRRKIRAGFRDFGGMGVAVLGIGSIAIEDEGKPPERVVKELLDAVLATENAEGLRRIFNGSACDRFLALLEEELKNRLRS